ncbi:hypothetical protein E0K89_011595 [Aquicoccus sp. SCR17]|nr:hypothetical protein [Carideicomes alvinocaridis]
MLERSRIPVPRPDDLDTSPRAKPAQGSAEAEATRHATFDRQEPILLGTFGLESDRRALLRLPDGGTAKVKPGDRVGRAIVMAIDDGSLVLNRAGTARRLAIPEG